MQWIEIILSRVGLRCAELGLGRPALAALARQRPLPTWQLRDELPPNLDDLAQRLPAIHERLNATVPLLEDPWDEPEEPETDLRWPSTVLLILVGILIAALWPGW